MPKFLRKQTGQLIQCNSQGIVLMFHRILSSDTSFGPYKNCCLEPAIFEKLIKTLSTHYNCLSPLDFFQYVTENHEKPAILITFDDGYKDNFEAALPVLEKYKTPALFFISTGLILGEEVPYEYLLSDKYHGQFKASQSSDLTEYSNQYDSEKLRIKRLSLPEKKEALKEMFEGYNPSKLLMNQKMVRDLASHPLCAIGSHGHWHSTMGAMTEPEMRESVLQSKSILKEFTNSTSNIFSYPYGSYNQKVTNTLDASGYQYAFTTKSASLQGRVNSLEIPRIEMTPELASQVIDRQSLSLD